MALHSPTTTHSSNPLQSGSHSHDSKPKTQPNSASANLVARSNSSHPSSSFNSSKPRGPLTDAEKARRKQKGLCLYCADPNHDWANCPRRLASAPKANALAVVPPYHQHLPFVSIDSTSSGNDHPQAPARSET